VEDALLADVATLAHPPRVVGVFRKREVSSTSSPTTLALWRVADPGNVGTLLRSADAFGAGVMLSDGCADPFGPKALRAGMGSTFRVPVSAFEVLPGAVALVAEGGEPLARIDFERHSNFVLGSEREGLPEDIVKQCEQRATIPTARVESLNVAMAGTLALYTRALWDTSRARP